VTESECPLIIYVPGLLPKPEPEIHREALLRCLLAGVRRIDASIAEAIDANDGSFDIVSWTYDFYRSHRDFNIDRAAVEAVIAQPEAGARDIAEAGAWTRRLTRWIYRLGDRLPFLIPHLASERMEVHLRDLRRYTRNENGIAEHTRRMLKIPLKAAAERHRPILLIAHSMGSIIAYDALWELSHTQREHLRIDLFLTMGSPLGQRMMQRQIKGSTAAGTERYPTNVRHWRNLSAIGDLTAIDPSLRNDFAEMLELGLLESFTDEEVLNYFRLEGELNVHSEYGYLANKKTAHTIAEWWRGHVSGAPREEC
jgi:hypothetical protein